MKILGILVNLIIINLKETFVSKVVIKYKKSKIIIKKSYNVNKNILKFIKYISNN